MINGPVKRIVENARRNSKKNIDVNFNLEECVRTVSEYCKKIVKEQPDITAEELKNMVLWMLYKVTEEYCKIANIRGSLFQLEAAKKIAENPEMVKPIYDRTLCSLEYYINNPNYNSNFRRACELVVAQAIIDKEELEKENFSIKKIVSNESATKQLKQQYSKNKTKLQELNQYKKLFFGDEYESVFTMIQLSIPGFEEQIREQQYETINLLYKFFTEFNVLLEFLKRQNFNIQNILFSGLSYEFSSGNHNRDKVGAKEIFEEEFLEDEDLESVLAYSLFMQNRFAKICQELNYGILCIDTLGFWQDIIDGKTDFKIPKDVEQGILKKEKCLRQLVQNLFSNIKENNITGNLTQEEKERGYVSYDPTKKIEQIVKQEGKNYKEIFDELLDSDNDLEHDIEIYKSLYIQTSNTYNTKDRLIAFFVRTLIDSKKTKNWGITPIEVGENGEIINVLENKDIDKILISIDYEGFNMPIRVHIDRQLLCDILRNYNGDTKIPIYEGAEDFIINGKLLTTNLLMPMQKDKKKTIREKLSKAKEGTEEYNLLEHLLFLADKDKFPKHLMEKVVTKEGIKYIRKPKRYFDLATGEQFTKEGDQYTKLEEKGNESDGR